MSLEIGVQINLVQNSSIVYASGLYHDLAPMAKQVNLSNDKTLYDIIWSPNKHGINFANDIIPLLEEGWTILKSNKPKYKAFNPENRNGTFTGLCFFIEEYKQACLDYPTSNIKVSND
jgi:hypothetical protein